MKKLIESIKRNVIGSLGVAMLAFVLFFTMGWVVTLALVSGVVVGILLGATDYAETTGTYSSGGGGPGQNSKTRQK